MTIDTVADPTFVTSADGTATEVGLFASRNAAATSTGETTGGWARDLLRGLASIAALTPASAASTAARSPRTRSAARSAMPAREKKRKSRTQAMPQTLAIPLKRCSRWWARTVRAAVG